MLPYWLPCHWDRPTHVHTQRNATGYFNVLNEEGRVVVGALLAPDPDVSLLETMPEQKHELHDRPFVLR